MPFDDRVRLAEAIRLSAQVGEQVWPGWRATPMPVLLVGDSLEYLISHPAPTPDFTSLGRDTLLGAEVLARRRTFPPGLLATFPAVGSVSTIVVGSAAATGKSSAAWVVTLLHEHFHQMQNGQRGYYDGVARLGLARGDTTGMWMLNYAFPYDSAPIAAAAERLAKALDTAMTTNGTAHTPEVRRAWHALMAGLDASDARYLQFQLWQEGVARWVEYAATRAAASAKEGPSPAFRALPDYEPYSALAERQRERLHDELAPLDLAVKHRVAFYPLGAAMATLLDHRGPAWKRSYWQQPFTLAPSRAAATPP